MFQNSLADASGATSPFNSQSIPLLAPAINIDPNPAKGGGNITVVDGAALMPEQGPSGTAADIEEWPASSQINVYTVRPGDSLGSIAKMFNVSVNTIVWANDIKDGTIHPGDSLVILPVTGVRHTIAKGETLASIAKTFKSNATEIAQYNGLDSSAALTEGSVVIIPQGELATAPVTSPAPGGHRRITRAPNNPAHDTGGPDYSGYYGWPVDGGVITQGLHGWNGVDIGAAKGTNILAAAGGTVLIARNNSGWNGGYGNYIVIQHNNGTQTLYAHASKVLVSPGDSVVAGQTIAKVGMTGEATGPHLHFEVRGAKNPFGGL